MKSLGLSAGRNPLLASTGYDAVIVSGRVYVAVDWQAAEDDRESYGMPVGRVLVLD